MFHTKEIRNFMALSLIQNALFMVGIRGINVLTAHKAAVTSYYMEPMVNVTILEDKDEAKEAFLTLAMETVAMAMATVTALASIFFSIASST
jgi:hypothetical protein